MSVEIQGVLSEIRFKNESNGYMVAILETEDEEIVVVGYMPIANAGETFSVVGNWAVHPTYGKQLEVVSYRQVMPNSLEGIEKYLASGIIKGIGAKTAKRLVDKFGTDTLDIMQFNPSLLIQVEGIGEAKANTIALAFQEQREIREVMLFLQQYGVSTAYALKIYKKYGERTIQLIQENPYRLAEDIFGIGFKIADTIAKRMGVNPCSPYRVMCGIKYVLGQYSLDGHTFAPKQELVEAVMNTLEVNEDLVEDSLTQMAFSNEVQLENLEGQIIVFALPFFYAETYVCKKLVELVQGIEDRLSEDLEGFISNIEKQEDITLADNQKNAVREAARNGLMVITGGPGTGKTTTINTIIKMFEDHNLSIALAAPTGRAAKKISEATGREAKTIHRLLEYCYLGDESGMNFNKDEDEPLAYDAIIIDEMSMVDILLMKSLLKAIIPGTRVILVGDVDQLPSVGPGNVLRDIIDSGIVKVVKLDQIFRQAQESMIIVNAHRINKGEYPHINQKQKDFYFISKGKHEGIATTIRDLCKKRLPSFNNCDSVKDIQVITPTRKGPLGMFKLNQELQAVLNPVHTSKEEKSINDRIFRVGDKVMQIKNNYNLKWKKESDGVEGDGVFNGDFGTIRQIDQEEKEIKVIFDEERCVTYDFSQLDELELAYCITIHKSQGSEFPIVIIPISFGPPMLFTRNLLYTAVTRAKELVVMVGMEAGLKRMVDNHNITKRYSGLGIRLKRLLNEGFVIFE